MGDEMGGVGAGVVGAMMASGLHGNRVFALEDDGIDVKSVLGRKEVVLLNLAQVLSWVPVLSAIVGIGRICLGSKLIQSNRSPQNSAEKMNLSTGAWAVTRGAVEVLTLGAIAPVNMVADIVMSLFVAIMER